MFRKKLSESGLYADVMTGRLSNTMFKKNRRQFEKDKKLLIAMLTVFREYRRQSHKMVHMTSSFDCANCPSDLRI